MSRPLHEFRCDESSAVDAASRRRLDRATARALAAAVAALAVATFVVTESTAAFGPQGTGAANRFDSGSIALVDDDQGRSLVVLENMAPGRPIERCITITYAGTVLPVDLTLGAEADGDIAEYVVARVEVGHSGGYESCAGFTAVGDVFDGSLSALVAGEPLAVGALRNEAEQATFRFTFDLVDDEAAEGRTGSIDFVWEAVPG